MVLWSQLSCVSVADQAWGGCFLLGEEGMVQTRSESWGQWIALVQVHQ